MPTNTSAVPQDIVKATPTVEGGIKFESATEEATEVTPVEQAKVYPHVQKMQDKLKAELEAGAAKVAAAKERMASRIIIPVSASERLSQGRTTPVFRPNDFTEYAKNFKSPAIARSKDSS